MNEDQSRKQTVSVPSASNIVLAAEKIDAFIKSSTDTQKLVDQLLRQFAAMRETVENQAKNREDGDGQLGRSFDRLAVEVRAVARIQGEQAEVLAQTRAIVGEHNETLGQIRALSKAAVDGGEANSLKLDALLKAMGHRVESASASQSAE